MKSIFVSHVFENEKYVNRMKKWEENGLMGDYVFTFETEDLRHKGQAAIKDHVKNKIRGAAIVLVLIGDDTHNHDWITKEVEYANSFHKIVCCVRVPLTNGGLPQILEKYQEIEFDPNSVLKALEG